MSTLETQYRKFLEANQKLKISFEEWKKVNARLIKQALVNMMKADEELGLYDEPFKHKVEVIPTEEILANRSNAYEFIDFDKQETLEEAAKKYANKNGDIPTTELEDAIFKQGFIDGAKWQQERMYSEEEVVDIAKQAFVLGKDFGLIGTFNEWFETVKKK